MEPPETETETDPEAVDPIGSADRYCRSCRYCLGDLTAPGAPGVCPECGRAFDRSDPKATLTTPGGDRPLLLRWPGALILVILVLVFLAQASLLPFPVAGSGGGLWEWRFHRYGYADGLWWWKGAAYGDHHENRDGMRITVSLSAGIASKVVAVAEDDGRHAFTVERSGDPAVWSIRVDDHDLAWPVGGSPELIRAVNFTREHRFGVSVYPPDGGIRLTPPGPIVASGTEADIFWSYVNAYGLIIDIPERVPPRADGWHPTLPPGETVEYPPSSPPASAVRPRTLYRRR